KPSSQDSQPDITDAVDGISQTCEVRVGRLWIRASPGSSEMSRFLRVYVTPCTSALRPDITDVFTVVLLMRDAEALTQLTVGLGDFRTMREIQAQDVPRDLGSCC